MLKKELLKEKEEGTNEEKKVTINMIKQEPVKEEVPKVDRDAEIKVFIMSTCIET